MTPLKIIFAGTPEFGVPSLEALFHSQHELIAVYTQPDRPSGRGRKVLPSPIKQWALKHNIPVYQPLNFKEAQDRQALAQIKPDLMVVIAYGLILPQTVLQIPQFGCINVHASLLPRWRGASPIQQAILHDDKQTGLTIMQMDAGLDTGKILNSVSCSIEAKDTSGSLHDKLSLLAPKPLLQTVNALEHYLTNAKEQNEQFATYSPKISKEQSRINWDQNAHTIACQIRAFIPWPIAYTQSNDTILRIHQAKVMALSTEKNPGTIIHIDRQGILVAAKRDGLLVEKIQFPGGKIISVADWLNAPNAQITPGAVFQ